MSQPSQTNLDSYPYACPLELFQNQIGALFRHFFT